MAKDALMPIAIVGMSCRLPGDVSTPGEFWQLLARGRSAWSEIPKDRFNASAYHHPDPEKKGTMNSRGGYFLSQNLEQFEPSFFNMTRKEAETMDPTQRLLLECSYEAFENAGMPKETIAGKSIGVFVGGPDCEQRVSNLRDLDDISSFEPTGNQSAFLAGRISYFYDLRGPTFTVDTACSSSMHALHLAVQSIRSGDSSEALVGASHLITQPDVWVSMAKMRLFSESGKTHAFDDRAKSGFARGEGAGCIVLKPLHKALADNDHIRAVISNTGISHNGTTMGIAAPSSDEQERLIKRVLSEANIDPSDVGFVEAHGTGTKVGDPIEAIGIFNALGRCRTADSPLYMGSVKSNIGHLENASGLISVMKAALMLEKSFVLPNADFQKPNKDIPLTEWNLQILSQQQPWPRGRSHICVGNYGFSGSNGHAVLKAAPPDTEKLDFDISENTDHITAKRLFVLSANDEEALKKSIEKLGIFLEQHAELYQTTMPRNLSYTLCQRRTHLPWRIAIVSDMCSNLAVALQSPDTVAKRSPSCPPRIAFVFTGQGAQWFAMGRELLKSHRVFIESIAASTSFVIDAGADFSLLDELTRSEDESRVGAAHISQPVCSAIQIGLTDLLRSWGIMPKSVTGHSSGEIAAAYAAGALDHRSAIQAAYYRGQSIIKLKSDYPCARGAMMATGVGLGELQPFLAQLPVGLKAVAACENSPMSTTVSGDDKAIDFIGELLSNEGIFNRKLLVDVAYHSPHMQMIADTYDDAISNIQPNNPTTPVAFFSSLRGKKIPISDLGPRYWVENLTNPVLFATALKALIEEQSPDIVIEMGPHAALKGPIMQSLKSTQIKTAPTYLPTLVRNRDAVETCLELAGQLHARGYEGLDYFNINHARAEDENPELISFLYPYPWSRRDCFYESRISKQHRVKQCVRHDLIGSLADWSSDPEPTWRNILRLHELPWLSQSCVMDHVIFPISAFVSMAIEAANHLAVARGTKPAAFEIKDLEIPNQLWLENERPVEILLNLRPTGSCTREGDEFSITSYENKRGWQVNCHGFIHAKANPSTDQSSMLGRTSLQSLPGCTLKTAKEFYSETAGNGITCPASFATLREVLTDRELSRASGCFFETSSTMPLTYETSYVAHPSLLDPLTQLVSAHIVSGDSNVYPVPISVQEVLVNIDNVCQITPGREYHAQSKRDPGHQTYTAELQVSGCQNSATVSYEGFKFTSMKKEAAEPTKPRELCYKIDWKSLQGHEEDATHAEQGISGGQSVTIVSGRPKSDDLVAALSSVVTRCLGKTPALADLPDIEDYAQFFIVILELDQSVLSSGNTSSFGRLQQLLTRNTGILWVTRGASSDAKSPDDNLALGLLRTIRSELASRTAILATDADTKLDIGGQGELIGEAFRRVIAPRLGGEESESEFEYAERNGALVTPRLLPDDDMNLLLHRETSQTPPYLQPLHQPDRRLLVTNEAEGYIDGSLHLEDAVFLKILGDHEVEIEVKATRLGRDDLTAALDNNSDAIIERSCSGRVTRLGHQVKGLGIGDRVYMLTEGRIGTHALGPAACTIPIPQETSFEQATLIPSLLGANFYALAEAARIMEGERVLIHVEDANGLAAIQIARDLGAQVFLVTNDEQQLKAVKKLEIIESQHIFNASSFYFKRDVLDATSGNGMDVILTSSSRSAAMRHEKILRSVAPLGRVVAVGTSTADQYSVNMKHIAAQNATFTSINLTKLAHVRPHLTTKILATVMQIWAQGIESNGIKPVILPLVEIERGMQAIQQFTLHPIIISFVHNDQVKITHRSLGGHINPDGTHMIVGGTGGLGHSVAKWMVRHGVRNILLVSRSGGDPESTNRLVRACQHEANILVRRCDVTSASEVRTLIHDCTKTMPPICGVIYAAMVLQDKMFEDLTYDEYRSVIRPKVDGTWNLHNSLTAINAKLDYFVMLSSASGILGSRGQAAYAAANTFLDAFAAFRVAQGLPAVALDLTAVTGVGYLAENKHREAEVAKNFGNETVSEQEVLGLLAIAVSGKCPPHCLTGLKLTVDESGALPYYAADARFTDLKARAIAASEALGTTTQQTESYKAAFQSASTEADACEVAVCGLQQKMAEVLSMAPADIDVMRSMSSYGLDSLSAIEIRNWITRELGAKLQILELLTVECVRELATLVVKRTSS